MIEPHIPVLLEEVITCLKPQTGDSYLDLTAGYGGHSEAVLDKIGPKAEAVLVDRDLNAVKYLKEKFSNRAHVHILDSDYYEASKKLNEAGKKFNLILADIGVSSPHLDNPERGFSYSYDGPLDMRMDQRSQLTAEEIVNSWSRDDLATILREYGEVNGAYGLVDRIIASRPYVTTSNLKAVIPGNYQRKQKLLMQVFQALRIAVNEELRQLEHSLPLWHAMLAPGGRLAVISFHSLEDRLVKRYFADHSGQTFDADLKSLTKNPLEASQNESVFNPRARSAKLRAVQRK